MDKLLRDFTSAEILLSVLRRNRYFHSGDPAKTRKQILAVAQPLLEEYLDDVPAHLKSLNLRQRFDRTLRTKQRQYFLYMIEIELVNRLNKESFRQCDYRLAFLPHCLRDLSRRCRAGVEDDIDYVCRRCSNVCYVRQVSDLLQEHGIRPYIWMNANLRKLFRRLKKEGREIGVLGMACLPELVNGMRLCARAKVPVVGIPLNANRCARWMGDFYDNSVDVQALKDLLD